MVKFGVVPSRPVALTVTAAALAVALSLPVAARAQVVRNTVGPSGTYGTIQAGIDSCGAGVTCSVDVETGIYLENLEFSSSLAAASIAVTGGWDATFTSRSQEAADTTIDGNDLDRVIEVRYAGELTIEGFTISGGNAIDVGGGIWIIPSGESNASVSLVNVRITDNLVVSSAGFAHGGGIYAQLDGSEHLEMNFCDIFENAVSSTAAGGAASGGGVSIAASGSATFLLEHSWIEENEAVSDTGQKRGGGHFIGAIGDSSGELTGVMVSGNTVSGAAPDVLGSGGELYLTGNAQVTVRRSAWAFNADTTGGVSQQLRVATYDASSVQLTDSAAALGDGDGARFVASDTSVQQLTNLTMVDNDATGIIADLYSSASINLSNTIAYGNGTDTALSAGVVESNNLIEIDPVFVAPGPPLYNYHLDEGSPALDAGNNAPPGGLGATDLDNRPRVENGTVDIGCYEGAGLLFFDGFEGGGTGEWSTTTS